LSAPGAPECAPRSRRTISAQTSRFSRRSIPSAATPARPRAGSTRRSGTLRGQPREHAFDTVKGSDYLGDQDAIEILCDEAPGDVYQLEHWGAVFSRTDDGGSRSGRSAQPASRERRTQPTSPATS
jgi:succinate dehydrogenase/fumarate reductase flavoprotein subunit